MSAPAQQAMSPADVKEMKDFLGVAAVSGATIEAFEKHGVAKQQLAQMEDTHMQQMNEHHGGRPVAHQEGYQGIESGRKQGAGPESC